MRSFQFQRRATNDLVHGRLRCAVGMPAAQSVVSNRPNPRREDTDPARWGKQSGNVLKDQRHANRIHCKDLRHRLRINGRQGFFWRGTIGREDTHGDDHAIKRPLNGPQNTINRSRVGHVQTMVATR